MSHPRRAMLKNNQTLILSTTPIGQGVSTSIGFSEHMDDLYLPQAACEFDEPDSNP